MFSKFMNPLTILIILIVTGIAVHLAFLHFTKSPKILEIRDFSCPGMTGFTFKYPVFEGWEVKDVTKPSSDQDRCLVWLKWPNGSISPTVAPTIQVTKTASPKEIGGLIPGFPGPASPKNPQGITYDVWTETGAYHFFTANFEVKIELSGVSNALGEGFQDDLFWKTVIESFKLTDIKITKEQALEIVRSDLHLDFKPINFDPNDYNIEAKLGSDGWHIDYSLKNPPPHLRGGGAPHYIINSETGNIIKKWFDR